MEPACAVLEISPSTYYAAKKREEYPSARDERDEELKMAITRAREKKGRRLYGANPGFSRGFGGLAARLNGKVLLTWDDKGCLGTYRSRFEEHFQRARYRMVAWS